MIEKFCGKCKYVQHYRNEAPCSTCENCSNWEGVEMKEEINHPERYGKKDEKVQELKKARWYIDKLIESSSEYDKEDVEDLIRSFG